MQELTLSIMAHGPDPVGDLRPLLDEFEAQHRCRVRVLVFRWEKSWSEVSRLALHQGSVHISEVGANWVHNLQAMNALRPFGEDEIASMGGAAAFLPASWHSAQAGDRDAVWAIPWLADTRLVVYRRALLEQAGVDPASAFQTPTQFAQTLERLQANGVANPWVVPTQSVRRTLHNVASWVWYQGGDFVSRDDQHVLLDHTGTCAGMRAYFELYRYLAPAARYLTSRESDGLFLQEPVGVTISGPWMLLLTQLRESPDDLGVALPPGPPFVGGSSLVVWGHSPRRASLAVELVRFLTDRPAQAAYCPRVGLLPVRLDMLAEPPFDSEPPHLVMAQALRAGRSFPSSTRWGLIEDSLRMALSRLGEDVLADPHLDLDQAITACLDRLVQRLDGVLATRS